MSEDDMTRRRNQKERIGDLEDSIAGMLALFKHLAVEVGDFSHNLSDLATHLMTRMGYIWEILEGKVGEETIPDSDENEENEGAEIVYFPTESDPDHDGVA